ncbi:MAG: hypothetical protein HKM93_16100 [Desulfobacteraceae bacterium]|nr:hypothetical protein [Desulfobacteraceae bacterium]
MKLLLSVFVIMLFVLGVDSVTCAADIHKAAKEGLLQEIKTILLNGENVDALDKHDMTPLYYAAANGRKEVCEFLISQGADLNAGREIGFTPLVGALNSRTKEGVEIFKLLVNQGADTGINVGGYTLLHQAVYSCHDESVRGIAEFLISAGAEINAKGYEDKTPLHMVGCLELGEMLISKGADIEARNEEGQTPLFVASSNNNADLCQLLISKGADVNAKDNRGWTPLRQAHDQCVSTQETRICEILQNHGGIK